MILFLRLCIGCLLQILPFAFLCLYPFKGNFKYSNRQVFLSLFVGFLFLSVLFGMSCLAIRHVVPQSHWYLCANIFFMIILIPCLLLYGFITHGSKGKKVFVFLFCVTAAFIMNSAINTVCRQLIDNQYGDGLPYDDVTIPVIAIFTCIFLPPLFALLKYKFVPMCDYLQKKEYIHLSFLSLLLLLILIVCLFPMTDNRFYELSSLYVYIVMMFVSLIIYTNIFQIFSIEKKRFESDFLLECSKKQLEVQNAYYENIFNKVEQTRRLRHDFRQQLILLQKYMLEQNEKKILEYLEENISYMDSLAIPNYSNHPIINILLYYYKTLSDEEGIPMEIRASQIPHMTISDSDLSVLIGNLLENALNGARSTNTDAKQISVHIVTQGNMFVITVDNSFNGKVNKKKDHYLSTKEQHTGYGLSSIQQICKKYNGGCSFSNEETIFHSSATIMMEP